MSFYGNIVNYFSAAFKKFQFGNKVIEPKSTDDTLIFTSSDEGNKIDFTVNKEEKKVTMTLDLTTLENALTISFEDGQIRQKGLVINLPSYNYNDKILTLKYIEEEDAN